MVVLSRSSPQTVLTHPAHHGSLESLKPSNSPNSPCSSSKEPTTTTTSNCILHSLRRELLSQHVPHQSQPAEIIYPDRQEGRLPSTRADDTDLLIRESVADNGRLRSTRVYQPAPVSTVKLDLYLSAPATSLLQLMPQQYNSGNAHRGQRIRGLPSKSPGCLRCPVTLKEPSSPAPSVSSALLSAVLLDTAEEKGATFDPRHAAAVGGGTSSCPTKGMPLALQSHDSGPSSLAHDKIPADEAAVVLEGLAQVLDAGMEYSHFRQRQPFVSSTASESKRITPSPSFSDSLPSLQGTGKSSSSSSSSIVTMGAAVKIQLRMEDSPLAASSLQEPSSMVLPISHAVQDRHVTCIAAERTASAPSSTPADTAELQQQQQQQQLPLASLVSQNCMYWDVQRPHTSTSSSTTMMRNRKGLSHFGHKGDDKQKDATKTMRAATTLIGNPPIEYIALQSSSECVKGMSTEELRSRCATWLTWLQEHPSSSSPCAMISHQGHSAGTTASSSRHLSSIERTGNGGAETNKVIHPLIEGGRGCRQLQTASKRLRSRSLVVEHTLGSADKATTEVNIDDSRDCLYCWTANQRSAALCNNSPTVLHAAAGKQRRNQLPGSTCSCRSSVMSSSANPQLHALIRQSSATCSHPPILSCMPSSANPLLMQSSKDGPVTAAAVVPGTASEVSAGPAVLTSHLGSSLHVSCNTTGFQSPTAISPSPSPPPMMKQGGKDPRCCKNWEFTEVDKVDDKVAMSESAVTDGRTGRRCRPGSETALSQEREVAAAAGMAAVYSMPRGAWRRQQQGKMTVKKRTPDSSKYTIMSSGTAAAATAGVNAGAALEYCIQDFAALEQQSRQYMSAAGVLSRRTAAAGAGGRQQDIVL